MLQGQKKPSGSSQHTILGRGVRSRKRAPEGPGVRPRQPHAVPSTKSLPGCLGHNKLQSENHQKRTILRLRNLTLRRTKTVKQMDYRGGAERTCCAPVRAARTRVAPACTCLFRDQGERPKTVPSKEVTHPPAGQPLTPNSLKNTKGRIHQNKNHPVVHSGHMGRFDTKSPS